MLELTSLSPIDSTKAFQYHWFYWRILGLYGPETDIISQRNFYTGYAIILNFTLMVGAFMPMICKCFLTDSLTELCETLHVALPDAILLFKYANAWIVLDQLRAMHLTLHYLDGRLQSEDERQIIRQAVRIAKLTFVSMLRLFYVVLAGALLFVIFSPERQLMFGATYPWNWRGSKRSYALTLFLQFSCIGVHAIMDTTNDTYPQAYITIVAAHIKALSIRVERIGQFSCSLRRKEDQAMAYEQLIACIKDHQTILKLQETLQSSLSMACFLQFFCTGVSQCALCFFAFNISLNAMRVINLLMLLTAITAEAFIICYAAELIYHESEQLRLAIYSCNWTNQDVKFQRTLRFMLLRSQRLNFMMAAKIIPARISTLLTVLKGAYSLFTLLGHFSSKS